MAIVRTPLLSFKASGTLSRSVTYGHWKRIDTVREYVVPTNPRTVAQTTHRSKFAIAVAQAKASWLDQSFRDGARVSASKDPRNITPFNWAVDWYMG